MTDLSKLSDDDLKALYSKAAPDLGSMSDEQLQAAYKATPQRGVIDKLTGRDGGERYQTWPEKAARELFAIPQRNIEAAYSAPAGSREASEAMIGPALDAAGAATPVSAASRAMALPIAKSVETPTARELVDAAGRQFDAFRNSGVQYSANALGDWSRTAQQELLNRGIHPIDAPATYGKLQALENAPTGAFATPANLHSLRQSLQATAQNFNPQAARDQLAASRGIEALDSFIASPPAAGVLAGTPSAASVPFNAARGNFAAAQRANSITGDLDRATTGILERSEGRAQAANSGRNIDNTIRQKAEALLEKPKAVSGINDAEMGALQHVVDGGGVRNSARYISNLLGGGGGFGQAFTAGVGAGIGGAAGGGVGAAVGAAAPFAVGTTAKSLANMLAKRDLRSVDELMRTRSPLYEERLANPGNVAITAEQRAALAKAMLLEQMGQQQ